MFRRIFIAAAGAAAAVITFAAPALATSGAHFFHDTGATVADNGSLSVTIDEAGVGQQLVDYDVSWTAVADYGCINGGGNHPQASNKETVSTGGDALISFSPVNGRVHATIDVAGTPPPVTNGFTCPNGQALVLADVTYSASLSDLTNVVSKDVSASRIFFTFRK